MKPVKKEFSAGKLLFIYITALFVMHLLFSVLSLRYAQIHNDILHKTEDMLLPYINWVVSALLTGFRFGVLLYAFYNFSQKNARPYFVVSVISFVVGRITELAVSRATVAVFSNAWYYYMTSAGLSLVIDLAICLLAVLICLSQKKAGKPLWNSYLSCAIVTLAVTAAEQGYYIVRSLTDVKRAYGDLELGMGDKLALAGDILSPFVAAAAVFGVMLLCSLLLGKGEKE